MAIPPEARTVGRFVGEVARAYGDRTAVQYGETESLTYRELDERSRVLARGLLARGAGKGSRIAIMMPNGPGWAVAFAAVTRIGAVCVPLSTFLKPPELARVLRHADVQGIVLQPGFLGRDFVATLSGVLAGADGPDLVVPAIPHLRWAAVTAGEVPAWGRPLSWLTEPADARYDDALLDAVEAEVHPDDTAVMIYTSGQSADPKGVLHTHNGLLIKIHYLTAMQYYTEGQSRTSMMPFFWVGGLLLDLLCPLAAGWTVLCAERATSMGAGGLIGSGRRPHPADPKTGLRSGLGMSETLATYSWGRDLPREESPLCVPMEEFQPGFTVKVVGPDGTECKEGEPGEIIIRGPSLTVGLQKVDRSSVFDADGFYHTYDEGVVENGALHLLGRLSDMIKTAGANVAPAEVERELVGLDGVAGAYVVAVPDDERGQLVGAAIVPEDGVQLDLPALRAALRERLSSYKVPRLAAVVTSAEVPVTPTMKIRKPELAALVRERGVALDG